MDIPGEPRPTPEQWDAVGRFLDSITPGGMTPRGRELIDAAKRQSTPPAPPAPPPAAPPAAPEPLTFDVLCAIDPSLRNLERYVRARAAEAYRKRNGCANGAWYGYDRFRDLGNPKQRLVAHVGHFRSARPAANTTPEQEAVLRSSEAYDVAYQHLYRLMPDRRNCGCW